MSTIDAYHEYAEGLNTRRSWESFVRATRFIPGGGSSNAQCYPTYEQYPLTFKKGADGSGTQTIVQGLAQYGVQIYFTSLKKITNYREFLECDGVQFTRYHREMLKRGILVHPLQYQHMFVSTAHTEDDIDMTLKAAKESVQAVS